MALVIVVAVGAFLWWFAPLGLYACDIRPGGVQECYLAEDDFEVSVARTVSVVGAAISIAAAIVLLGLLIMPLIRRPAR